MKIQLATIGIIAAFGLTACETTQPTNANRASTNSNTATVVNSNSTGSNSNSLSPVTTTGNTMMNSNRTSINYNGTAKENESSRTNIEAEAKQAGRTIGSGANDWWLWSKTRAALATENDLRDSTISVDVANDVVTLTGNVANKEQVTKADKVAKGITGVKSVVNKLAVNANDTVLPNVTKSNTAPAKKS